MRSTVRLEGFPGFVDSCVYTINAQTDTLLTAPSFLDVERLRFLSYHGVPDELRGTVWKILIPKLCANVSFGEDEAPQSKMTKAEIAKIIKDSAATYQLEEPFFRKPVVREKLEKYALNYYETRRWETNTKPELVVHYLGPFLYTLRKNDVEPCFLTFMEALDAHNSTANKERCFRKFMSLFRSELPQLCAFFEDEELEPRRWVISWHQSLFAKQLSFRCLLRLWDSYFSCGPESNLFELHLYVCLALLKFYQSDMLDKAYPEIRAFMERIPDIDVERVVAQAQNLMET